jgi:hypothetical protein
MRSINSVSDDLLATVLLLLVPPFRVFVDENELLRELFCLFV